MKRRTRIRYTDSQKAVRPRTGKYLIDANGSLNGGTVAVTLSTPLSDAWLAWVAQFSDTLTADFLSPVHGWFMPSEIDTRDTDAIPVCPEPPDLQLLLEALHAAAVAGDVEATRMLQLLRQLLH